jgi:uncharacterized membrane protein
LWAQINLIFPVGSQIWWLCLSTRFSVIQQVGLVFSCQNKYEKAVNFYVNATSLLIGLGALIVHRRANHVLQKKVFSYRQQVCLLNIIWLFRFDFKYFST